MRNTGVAVAGQIQEIEKRGAVGEWDPPMRSGVPCLSDVSHIPTYPRLCRYFEHIEHPGLARRRGHLRDPSADDHVEETRFPDVGASEKGDFGVGRIECDIGPGEGADEPRVGQASFFWRGRSVTKRGCRPAVTHSALMATSRTSSRPGRSNMISVIISSRMARRPRAPVPRLIAFWAMAFKAS